LKLGTFSRLTSYSTQASPKQSKKEKLIGIVKSYDIQKYLERRILDRIGTPDPFRKTAAQFKFLPPIDVKLDEKNLKRLSHNQLLSVLMS